MAIYAADIATREAAVAGQFNDSGGRVAEAVAVHYEIGGLPKLTEVDHAAGAVDLLKQFCAIQTVSTESGDDAYSFLDQAPADPKVSMLLFRPAGLGDRVGHRDIRSDAQAYMESYQIYGPLSPWTLYGQHQPGLATIQLFALPGKRRPRVGQCLYLWAAAGVAQYVQLISVSTALEEFYGDPAGVCKGNYTLEIHACGIYSPLTVTLAGYAATCTPPSNPTPSVRECVTVTGRRFYALSSLTAAAPAGSVSVQLDSIYGYAAPSARGEQALVDQAALTAGGQTVTSGGVQFTVYGPAHTYHEAVGMADRRLNYTALLDPMPAAGGKVLVHVRILGDWFTVQEGAASDVGAITAVNRMTGSASLALAFLPDPDSFLIWEWPSGVHLVDAAGTAQISGWLVTGLLPEPVSPGSASVAWVSGGVPKAAAASVAGAVTGDASGYVVAATGAFWLDVSAARPDSDSGGLHWSYTATATETEIFAGLAPDAGGWVVFDLAQAPVPGSLRLSWPVLQETKKTSGSGGAAASSSTTSTGGGAYATTWNNPAGGADEESLSESRTTLWRTCIENGAGAFALGTIDGTEVMLHVVDSATHEQWSGSAGWSETLVADTLVGAVIASYQLAGAITAPQTYDHPVTELVFTIQPGGTRSIAPGTLRFRIGSTAYSDLAGTGGIYLATGEAVGSVDYATRTVSLAVWSGSGAAVAITSCILVRGQWTSDSMAFRLAGSPVATGSVQIAATTETGQFLTLMDPGTGSIPAPHTGTINHELGMVAVAFAAPVFSGTVRYNAVALTIVPLNPDVIGIDPVRLPPDGRVPVLARGDLCVVFQDYATGSALAPNTTLDLGVENLGAVYIEDGAGEQTEQLPALLAGGNTAAITGRNGRAGPLEYAVLEDAYQRELPGSMYSANMSAWSVALAATVDLAGYELPLAVRYRALAHPDHYRVDLQAGTVRMESDMAVAGYTLPATVRWRVQDMRVVSDLVPTGLVTFQTALSHAFTSAAKLAGVLFHGDLQARVSNIFEQNTGATGAWDDALVADAPTGGARYDWVAFPIGVSNRGTIRERWRLVKRSDGAWDVRGETVGVIAVWNGTSRLDAKRLSSQTDPYFTVYHEGLGSGWATGNFIQFETHAAQGPLWLARVVRPGDATVRVDRYRLRHRLGVD